MNLELVEQIVALVGEYPVSEISVEHEGQRICVRRPLTVMPIASVEALAADVIENIDAKASAEAVEASPETPPEEARMLLATIVGIFHHADPPLPYAAQVRSGQIVGYIESMKLMNDVIAEENGRVTDVLVEDGAPVEYGQALFRLAA